MCLQKAVKEKPPADTLTPLGGFFVAGEVIPVTEERAKRKLIAIFSVDVKGYSRLMEEDEAATVETLKRYREVISSLIRQFIGRVVDYPGDNILAKFASVCELAPKVIDSIEKAHTEHGPIGRFKLPFNLARLLWDEPCSNGELFGRRTNH